MLHTNTALRQLLREREKNHHVTALLLQLFSDYRQALKARSLFDFRHATWPIDYATKNKNNLSASSHTIAILTGVV